MTFIKLVVGLLTNSLGILAEALHSALDLIAAIITFIAVSLSGKESDYDHQFGHGKIENFSALIETLILIITCGWIIIEAFERIVHPVTPEVNFLSFAVIFIAIIVDYNRSKRLYKVAKETRSQALEADALHFSTDILSSIVVIFGLIFVSIGFPIGDAIAALMVAIIVAWISVKLGLSTINALMDKVPLQEYNLISKCIEQEFPEYQIERLRLRESGPDILGDLIIGIPDFISLSEFHSMREIIHAKIQSIVQNVELLIVAHPITGQKEDIQNLISIKKIQHVINNIHIEGLSEYDTHNVTYYTRNKEKNLDIHLLLPKDYSLNQAHEVLVFFEKEIKMKLPQLDNVKIHLEPLKRVKKGDIESYPDKDVIREEIQNILAKNSHIIEILKIETSFHKGRFIIFLSISLDGNQSLVQAHEITEQIELELYSKLKNIDKILIQTKPDK